MPKSKRAALVTKRANCTATGSLRPSSSRKRRRSSSEVSCPTIWLMGSPTNLNSTKASSATVSMTMAASNSRRIAKASIARSVAGVTPERRRARLLHLCPVEQDLVVRALHDLHLLGHAPGQRLLMQRQHPDFLVIDAEGLGDHLVALGRIGLDQDLLGEVLDLLVAIAAVVEGAAFAVSVAAAHDIGNHVPAIE